MKTKYFVYIFLAGIIIFLSVPTFHLLKTKLIEDEFEAFYPNGYVNDQSHLNLTKVDSIVTVKSDFEELTQQLKSLIQYAQKNELRISIAGTKHSMGGHTIAENGIQLNLLPFNKMHLGTTNNILTIGSGATWGQAIKYLDSYDRSVAIMQAFSTFSIGGSISVNGHGWQKNLPPLSSSILSFRILLSDGQIKTCSRTENEELFRLAIGGYGLFGIILDVKMRVVPNTALCYKTVNMSTENYLNFYKRCVTDNPKAELVFGRLRICKKNFLEEASLNFFEKTELKPSPINLNNKNNVESKRVIFRGSVNSEYGKRLRWDLEKIGNNISKNEIYSRNELLNDDVSLIENKDTNSTDILHEYFIPQRNFMQFINAIKTPLLETKIDLLNITIRRVETDNDAFLNYANEPVYGFVMLFNQQKTANAENAMKQLTETLVDCASYAQGTYYLPYRLHVSREKLHKIYPQANRFFELKRKYDPKGIFSNQFYEKYK